MQVVALILLILWLLGFLLAPALGGFVHLLLVIAVVLFIASLLASRGRARNRRF